MNINNQHQYRFWTKVDKNSGIFGEDGKYKTECWIWIARLDKDGYGVFTINGKGYRAHRISYQIEYNKIDNNLTIDHLCRSRNCIRPDHLEQTTSRENIMRGHGLAVINSRKTQCINGHEFNKENTGIDLNGKRYCIICRRKNYHWKGGVANPDKVCCKRGHPFDQDNTYITSKGIRQCRLCRSEYGKRHRKLYPERYQQYEKNRTRNKKF